MIALVIWGELTPSQPSPFHLWDKILHFGAYASLAGLASLAVGHRRPALAAVAGLIVLGGAMEIIQGMVGRDMSIWDEAANSLGAGTGAAVAWLYFSILRGRRLVGSGTPD